MEGPAVSGAAVVAAAVTRGVVGMVAAGSGVVGGWCGVEEGVGGGVASAATVTAVLSWKQARGEVWALGAGLGVRKGIGGARQ